MDTIMQFVYWYPPSEMTPEDISAINSDGAYGLILVNINTGTLFGTNIVFMPFANNTAQIVLTPQAYATWYQNNYAKASENSTLTAIYNFVSQPINNYPNDNAQVGAYLQQQGFYWKPYVSNYANYYNVDSSAINPVQAYGFTSNELYMLIRSEQATQQATGNNGLATTSSLSSEALSSQESQQQQALQNQQQNTQSFAQIGANDISNALNNAGKNLANDIKPFIPNIELGLVILGAFILIAIFVYGYAKSR